MEKSIQELWENCLSVIKTSIPEHAYELWIKPIKPVSLNGNIFKIEAPNKFFVDWIREHIQQTIEEALSKQLKIPISLEYSTVQNLDDILKTREQIIEPVSTPIDESIFAESQFNPKYTFEKFVVGTANKFPHAAAIAVADAPGKAYNPLFLYGGVGLGKTHLLHAIGHKMKMNNPAAKILYINCEKFANEMIEAITKGSMPKFHQKYRSLDALLIDDVQFLGKGEQLQEVFHHTFNALYDSGKQIILSADSAPKEILMLQERLKSRFEWGLVADIQPPDLETRIAILKNKVVDEKIHVPEDVILFIASSIKANIRELEGALIRIVAHASLTGTSISVDRAKEILKDIVRAPSESSEPVTLDTIQKVVCKNFNIDVKDIKGKRRTDAIAHPRQIAMYLARKHTEMSLIEIGEMFGGRDHTTVLYAYDKIKKDIEKDKFFASLISKLEQELRTTE